MANKAKGALILGGARGGARLMLLKIKSSQCVTAWAL